ncbi:SDR family NAD(P)-dependent oxidoreductase [Skermanella mucosa]|uniref:oxidoreductase n=1 Tax=Skermanella mucosa TaxID=1789672 RepID=UPI00192B51E8|nr:oxidoreductase [Skermanella mucosa]UEM21640.1 SDR family NAD(P)-dependent oxidoreductase [Skermanella mucosa]
MTTDSSPVWFITGCSTGFGKELARMVLDRGWRAVVTARDADRVRDLTRGYEDRALALSLDVTDAGQVASSVKAAEDRFGAIDVLVNNAGYGYQAPVEEGDDAEIRAMFEANVFGLAAMIRAVLPGMRTRKRGHIVNLSSVAGFVGFPGSGYYAATKHAVEGLSDSLAREVEPLGIKVLCVEPGPFRTDWAGRSLKQTPSRVPDYAETAAARMRATADISGKQPGDPVRACAAMIKAVEAENPPRHLVLGAFGVDAVRGKLAGVIEEIDAWKETSLGADFPKD